jgi:hypothetical protein
VRSDPPLLSRRFGSVLCCSSQKQGEERSRAAQQMRTSTRSTAITRALVDPSNGVDLPIELARIVSSYAGSHGYAIGLLKAEMISATTKRLAVSTDGRWLHCVDSNCFVLIVDLTGRMHARSALAPHSHRSFARTHCHSQPCAVLYCAVCAYRYEVRCAMCRVPSVQRRAIVRFT